jgi:nitrous oxidase accessory protein NosD
MQTLRRLVAVLTFPAIAYLGAACERETPTGATAVPRISASAYGTPNIWVNVLDLTPHPPGTSCMDAGYMTISAAVAAANPGDIIQVCPGLYPEQVQINKTLTLLGAKVGVDARTRTTPPLPTVESIIDDACGPVQIMANKVVLDGFTVQGSILPDPCFIAGIWSNPGFSGTNGGHTILNNIVQNNISGIELDSDCLFPTLVQFNLIQNNSMPGPGQGNGIETNFGLCNATIDNNKFSGDVSTSMLFVATQSGLTISNNELVGGTPERIFLANTSSSSITGNVSIGSTSSGTIRFFSGNSNVTVTSNTLFNGMRGIRVDDLDPLNPAGNSGIDAHFNCIQGNSIAGLEVASGDYTGTLHAENNWWGSKTGPMNPSNPGGNGDRVIDPDNNVDFIPFLTSCPTGAPPPPSMVTGGGQVSVSGGTASFGFSAKQSTQSGHLDYMNHVTRAHLNCTVNMVVISSATMAHLEGTCTTNSAAPSFKADVEDNGTPGKNKDRFKITYTDQFGLHVDEGGPGTIISGNIEIH